jgi:N-acetylmuramoyl-L-alanine amidase
VGRLAAALIVSLSLPVFAGVEQRFAEAKADAARLKRDGARAKFRHNWERVIERFEQIAKTRDARAPDALFNAARLYEDLSRVSRAREDVQAAVAAYERLAERHPRSRLADDALYAAARMRLERRGDTAGARADLERLLAEQSAGDMAGAAKALLARLPAPKPVTETVAATATELKKIDPATLSEQAGLKVRKVVVDPGHGGHDSGAVGAGGAQEKDVCLGVAKRLAERLRDMGLEVELTRDDDRFVPLEERTDFANAAKADLFISIHANASAPGKKSHGVETYFLDVAHDRYALRLAARENATTEHTVSDLQLILADLATKSNAADSERLARKVQAALAGKLKAKSLGVKHALFFVLLGAKMPAILVEAGFITHAKEGKKLADPKYQEEAAAAIQQGVKEFIDSRERLAQVD